jgi:DNA-binding NarL/FixJ family response regulator
MPNKTRILLADDHDLFRQGVAGLINGEADLEVVGQAADGLEALILARDLRPDLIVMDINMPISDGLEATRLIRKQLSDIPIVMLTVRDGEKTLFDAIRAGANGYILKDADTATFLQGIRSVLEGEAVIPPKLAANLLDEFARLASRQAASAEDQCDDYGLTGRELDVLKRIAGGATDKEIASQLHLSVHTIKSHVRNVLQKLHAANRWQAARKARDEGLLDE